MQLSLRQSKGCNLSEIYYCKLFLRSCLCYEINVIFNKLSVSWNVMWLHCTALHGSVLYHVDVLDTVQESYCSIALCRIFICGDSV